MIAFFPIRQLTLLEIKSATEVDAELKALVTIIKKRLAREQGRLTTQVAGFLFF